MRKLSFSNSYYLSAIYNNIKLSIVIMVFALIKYSMGYSQFVSPEFSQIISPSPEAANLGQYGDIPISYNTGTPNISIPIYELKGKNISLPISLNYDSKGNKVKGGVQLTHNFLYNTERVYLSPGVTVWFRI